jgi:hypothetical protein
VVASDRCGVEELFVAHVPGNEARAMVRCGPGWTRSWTAEFRVGGAKAVTSWGEVGSVDLARIAPVRAFSFARGQRHRPGLQFVAATGRHHGFESLAEQRLLLALDFAGAVVDVASQPFRLRFEAEDGARSHIPDFLAVTTNGAWLFDVRPAGRIGPRDEVAFAASAEAALAAGWGYRVVTGWRGQVLTGLDALSAQRRPLPDPSGIGSEVLGLAAAGDRRFGDLAGLGPDQGLRRAHVLHLLWTRRLGVDLAVPLADASPVWIAAGEDR